MALTRKLGYLGGRRFPDWAWIHAAPAGRKMQTRDGDPGYSLTAVESDRGTVGRFEVRDGDIPITPNERAEVSTGYGSFFRAGTRSWVRVAFRLPVLALPRGWGQLVAFQTHGLDGHPPTLGIYHFAAEPTVLQVIHHDAQGRNAGALARIPIQDADAWYDLDLDVHWNQQGSCTVYSGGERAGGRTGIATVRQEGGVYVQQGCYRDVRTTGITVVEAVGLEVHDTRPDPASPMVAGDHQAPEPTPDPGLAMRRAVKAELDQARAALNRATALLDA